MLEIRPVAGCKALNQFIKVPHHLYKDDPNYVAQLNFERKVHFSCKNPFFKHAEHQFFVAYDNEQPVGRIAAVINELAQSEDKPKEGHFGCVEAKDEATMQALLAKAEEWLKERGISRVLGPFSLSINDEAGLLVKGFDGPPMMLMNYAPEWYKPAIEAAGYGVAKTLIAYYFNMKKDMAEAAIKMAKSAEKKETVVERSFDIKNLKAELVMVMNIFNDAWKKNWGFIPMTEDEIGYMAHNMKPILNPNYARIIEVEGKPAAMIIGLPNINEAIYGLNGKLFPFGWAKLLWRLKVKKLKSARVVLMGIDSNLQRGFLGGSLAMLLMKRIHEEGRKGNVQDVELSWILEDNTPMRRMIEMVGCEEYRHYQIFEKSL